MKKTNQENTVKNPDLLLYPKQNSLKTSNDLRNIKKFVIRNY